MNTRHFRLLLSAVSLHGVTALAADAPLPFAEAVFTEIVNDVQVVRAGDASAVKAERNAKFRAPDLVRTGRKSRAQLTAADGTVARIGSNAVFSFDKDSRTMNLQSGSVLFHSPTGKGGGTVVTNSATASVIGTTIVVSATADGGFKMLVLEGVAKVVFPNGAVSTVNAGQMTFVLPGAKVDTKGGTADDAGKGDGQKSDGSLGGRPGPVLNFDLGALNGDSGLVGGFTSELPSAGKIRSALREQRQRVGDGELRATGLPILGAESGDTIILGDPNVIQQVMQLRAATEQQRLIEAANRSLALDGATPPPESFVFRNAVEIPAGLRPAGETALGGYLQGLAAGDLKLTGSAFDLGFMSGRAHADVFGLKSLALGTITFLAPDGLTSLRIGGKQVNIAAGSVVTAEFASLPDAVTPSAFRVESFSGATYAGVTFQNLSGDVRLVTLTGDLRVSGGAVNASASVGHADFFAQDGTVELTGASVLAGPAIHVVGRRGVLLDGAALNASHVSLLSDAGAVVVRNGASVNGYGDRSLTVAGDGITLEDAQLSTPGLASFDARARDFSMTGGSVNADSITIKGARITLTGGSGTISPDVIVTDGGQAALTSPTALSLGGGIRAQLALTLEAADTLTVNPGFDARGDTVNLKARGLDMSGGGVYADGGALVAEVTDVRMQDGAQLVGATSAVVTATGKVELLNGAAVRSSTDRVVVSGATLSMDGATMHASEASGSGLLLVNVSGELQVKGASTLAGAGVRLVSSAGQVRLESGSILANGGTQGGLMGMTAAESGPLPEGVFVAGAGVRLGEGLVIQGGAGLVELAAVTKSGATESLHDLSITHAAITGNGVDLKGDSISIVGTGGSEDANGNITFGGEVRAGARALRVNGGSLSVRDYTEMTGDTAFVNLAGEATLHLARIKATNGVLDLSANALDLTSAELSGVGGLNLTLTGAATFDRADLTSELAQITLQAESLTFADGRVTAQSDVFVRTTGDQSWSGGEVSAARVRFGGVATALPGTVALDSTNLTVETFTVVAHTVELTNVIVASATTAGALPEVTLRSDSGLLNAASIRSSGDQLTLTASYSVLTGATNLNGLLMSVQGADTEVVSAGLVWAPENNLGDASLPVHVLSLGAVDYRGPAAKLNYARNTDFDTASLTRFNPDLPRSNLFRQSAPVTLAYADFGLTGSETLPPVDAGVAHSLLEVNGLLARNIVLSGDLTLDLTALNPTGEEINDRVDLVAMNDFKWNGALTLYRDAASHRRLEIRARNIVIGAGASLIVDLPYDPAYAANDSSVLVASMNTLAVNGTVSAPVTIRNPAGSVDLGSALGDVLLNHANLIAGDQFVDPQASFPAPGPLQRGTISLATFSPTAQIRVVGGELLAHADALRGDGIEIESATVDLSGVKLRAESRSAITAGSEPVYTSEAGSGALGGITDVTAGQYKSTGAIRIYGTALVKIQGGTLAAADVAIGTSTQPSADPLQGSIEMDGTKFVMAESQPVFDTQTSQWIRSTGIAMEARTVNLKNLVFPDRVQVRLRSQDGVLNIDTGAGSLFGAVNFSNVGVRTAGDTQNPAGATTLLNTSTNINAKVWVESGKVYFNKTLDANTIGASSASGAAIHIQSAGAANQQGLHGSNF